ncbi:hypothetical protein [Rhizobium leucaenae]|uniref:hypothetical protein n=1 Tax=Rhizobium leucaenae TaxID=29450 RepID=UPI0007EE3ECF|nr:hypothetical protein [Rhizobium leucaenae]
MLDAIRLYIITECPEEALARTLQCATTNAPSWVRVVNDPEDILKIPNGAKCIAVWFSSRKRMSQAEIAWRERRLMDGIVGLEDGDWSKLEAWIARKHAPAAEDIPENNADIPRPITPKPEIRNLVQSQRWT